MTWLVRGLPFRMGNASLALTEDLKLYALSDVSIGGNWRLIECDLTIAPPDCTTKDTGVQIPGTASEFNIRDVLIEGDHIYGCYAALIRGVARNIDQLVCYKFNRQTGEGSLHGSVNPTGARTMFEIPQMVKIKEDIFYAKARTQEYEWRILRFKGSPSQITDRAHWETIGVLVNDFPVVMDTCPDGRPRYTDCTPAWPINERYLVIACNNRCLRSDVPRNSFGLFIFDTFKEKLLGPDLSEIPFGGTSVNDAVRINITEGVPSGLLFGLHPSITVVDLAGKRAYGDAAVYVWRTGLVAVFGITEINLESKTARFVERPGQARVHGVTEDGKIVLTEPGAVRLYDPETRTLIDALNVPGLEPAPGQVCLNTEDVYRRIDTIIPSRTHIILPPNWQDGLRIPKRIEVASPAEGQLSVRVAFQLAPSRVRIRLWRVYEQTIEREEIEPGAGIINRIYSGLSPGKYRVEVTSL